MSDDIERFTCGDCGHVFPDATATSLEDRAPCLDCGSTARTGHVTLELRVGVRASMRGIGRPAGGGRPFVEFIENELSWFRKLGRWHVISRMINRRDNHYDKVVTDAETGEVVHECHEALSEHQGHGSARRP